MLRLKSSVQLSRTMRAITLILFLTIVPVSSFAQSSPDMDEPPEVEVYKEGEWGGIPGMNGSGITLINQTSFPFLMGAAITSYTVAELVGKDSTLNYYQSRLGLYGVTNRTTIAFQSFGIEKRVAPWFGIGVEGIMQQWKTRMPSNHSGFGVGLNTYYRWHLFGKKRLSPYLEYGAGVFQGFRKLPFNGSNFTFHLTTSLGLEYTFKDQNKMRLSYGYLHQSNNDLFEPNPGLDGGGLQFTFLWFWAKSKH